MLWAGLVIMVLIAWHIAQSQTGAEKECKQLRKEISDLAGRRGDERASRVWHESQTTWRARKNLEALSTEVANEMRTAGKLYFTLTGRVRDLRLTPNPRRTGIDLLVPLAGGHAHFSLEVEGGRYLASTTDKWVVETLERFGEGERVTVGGITRFQGPGFLNLGRLPVDGNTIRGTIEVETMELKAE